jgi:hypothetical protein
MALPNQTMGGWSPERESTSEKVVPIWEGEPMTHRVESPTRIHSASMREISYRLELDPHRGLHVEHGCGTMAC